MAVRWTMRVIVALIIVGTIAIFWDVMPPVRGYLNPLPPASFTVSEIEMLPPRQTQSYTAPADGVALHKFKFLGHTRRWYAHVPRTDAPLRSAVMLFHGSGRDGAAMIDMWQEAADRHGLVLIAPDARETDGWSRIKDGGRFTARVAAEAEDLLGRRFEHWFIFGHSAGAIHALTLMQSNSVTWDAVAVHGGGPDIASVAPAIRPIPYRTYIGDADHLFPVAYIESGARAIADAGHPSEMIIMKDHSHWFYDIGPDVADDAAIWFLDQINR